VLVKRIEINEGADPIVILEQYGIEVSRAVGEETVTSTSSYTRSCYSSSPPPQITRLLQEFDQMTRQDNRLK